MHRLWLAASVLLTAAGSQGLPYNPELLEKLRGPSAVQRREAAMDLAKMGADARAAVPDLQKALVDAEPVVRAAAAYALGEIGMSADPAAMTLLRTLTSDKDVMVRMECAGAIAKIGPKASRTVSGLTPLMRQELNAGVREAIADAIVRAGAHVKETYAGLADATGDPDPDVRSLALRALGRVGPPARSVLPAIERATGDSVPAVAEAAKLAQLRVNGEIEDPPEESDLKGKADHPEWKAFSVKDLTELLKSPTPSTRQKAVYQLEKRKADLGAGAKPAALALAGLVRDDPEPRVRAAAAGALGALGADAPELGKALTDLDPAVRIAAAKALGSLGAKGRAAAKPLALSRVRDVAAPVRRAAGDALQKIEKESEAFVASADPAQKKAAETSLKKLNDEIVKALTEALANADEDVRARAALCASELGPAAKEMAPQFLTLLKDRVVFVRAGSAMALGEMGAKEAVGALTPLLEDPDPRVRKRASEALTRLGSPVKPATPPIAAAPPPSDPPPAAPPNPDTPKPDTPKPDAPPAEAKPAAPPAGSLAAQVAELLYGEGGITDPSSRVDNGQVTLVLQLAHDRFDEGMAHMDGVRLILKVFQSLEPVQTLTIETVAHNGKLLHRYRAARVKAQPYFEKLDDPFQRRRMRDWWPYLTESAP